MSEHVDYPHMPGYLHGCPGCEANCHCTADSARCVYEGEHDEGDSATPGVL